MSEQQVTIELKEHWTELVERVRALDPALAGGLTIWFGMLQRAVLAADASVMIDGSEVVVPAKVKAEILRLRESTNNLEDRLESRRRL